YRPYSGVVGLAVVAGRFLATEGSSNHVDGHAGESAGVLEDGRIPFAPLHRLDRRRLGILTADDWHRAMPVVSGQDAEVPSIKSMQRGERYSTIFKDTRALARVTVDMVAASLSGKEAPGNDSKTHHTGVRAV